MRVIVTAGPTREPLDPVRYLTNRSSGKMGYALAHAFADAGHSVLLVSGPTDLDVPPGIDFVPVETAVEMHGAVSRHLPRMDAAVFAAAVADYRPASLSERKIKKTGETLTLELVRNPDILGDAREAMGFGGVLVGFAAETENLEANARDKLVRKHCDLIVANDVSRPGIGFDSDRNELLLVFPDHAVALPEDEKHHLAHRLVREVEALAAGRGTLSAS